MSAALPDAALPDTAAPPRTAPASRLPALGATAMRLLILAGLFASYPVALVIPMGAGFNLVFHIALPLFAILSLAAAVWLAITPWRQTGDAGRRGRARGVAAVLWGYVALHGLAAAWGRTPDAWRLAETAGPVILALFVAIAPRRLLPRRLDVALLVLWCVQVLHCLAQALADYEPVALAGNRNWAATLLAVLAPWACFALRRIGAPHRGLAAPLRRVVLQGAVVVISLVIVYACHCRATWLALGLYGLVFFLLKPCSWTGRVLLGGALAGLLLGVVVSWPEKVGEAIAKDIRLPLYANTLRLIADKPILGVGPGNFCRDFVLYRSRAQKARAVSAAVTEHPHCEFLNVAAAVGIPGAILWAAVLMVPLVLPTGRSTRRRLAHACLWVLVVHGLLDKALVQPPTQLLAVLFAGMLWRPWLRLRAAPEVRPPALRALCLPAAALAIVLGVHVAWRELTTGILFRRAYLAEARGQVLEGRGQSDAARQAYGEAYDAYVRATRVAPTNVRAHAYAGISANNKLRDPLRALPHLQAAMALEPNFAHLNGEAGLALGSLNRHNDAFTFFLREARLFPFDIEAMQRLLLCAAATGRLDMLAPVHRQLLDNAAHKATQALGEDRLRELAMAFRLAVSRGRSTEAILAARELLEPLAAQAVEPALFGYLDAPLAEALRREGAGEADAAFWHDLEAARQAWADGAPESPAALMAALDRLAAPGRLDPAALRPWFTVARLAGWSPACLRGPDPEAPWRWVELRRGDDAWLLDLEQRRLVEGADLVRLVTDSALQQSCAVDPAALQGQAVLIPAEPMQFLFRTQALAAMLRQTSRASAVPLPYSPMVEAARRQVRVATALPAAGLPLEALPVVYDQAALEAFARQRRAAAAPAPAATPAP